MTEGGLKMKSYILLAVLSIFILAGCSSTKDISDYDDVYYSTKSEKKQKKQQQKQKEMESATPDYYTESETVSTDYYVEDYEAGEYVTYGAEPGYSDSETVTTPDGTNYITNNYYGSGYDDYYDYSYASRINRFYGPSYGFGYYSPYYMGFYYDPWYSPYYYGSSFYFGYSWGWGGYGCGYPYYSNYYYPYNSYWYGYNQGYWDGYYAGGGYYDYGYNSYYGPRPSRGGSNSPSGSTGENISGIPNRANSFESTRPNINSGLGTSDDFSRSGSGGGNSGVAQSKNTMSRPSVGNVSETAGASEVAGPTRNNAVQSDVTKKTNTTTKPRYTYKRPAETNTSTRSEYQPGEGIGNTTQARTTPQQKYSKPANSSTSNSGNSATRDQGSSRNSQVYSKPRTSSNNVYTKPAQYNTSRNTNTQPSNTQTRQYNQPAKTNTNTRSYSQPTRTNTKSYSTPSRSSSSYSAPSRSGSSKSYSAPSRSSSGSSRSYSAPSRSSSGSSSGGSRSSSGRSSGGRK